MNVNRPNKTDRRPASAFSLIEMLVVVAIIALILKVAVTNLRGLSEGHEMEAASRQLIADLSSARASAIGGRCTVAVVFVPRLILTLDLTPYSPAEKQQILRLKAGAYTQYALIAFRRVGDQPGRATPRYLTEWKTLPDKTFIATNKFVNPPPDLTGFPYGTFPFPFADSPTNMPMPYVAFNYEGRLCNADVAGSLLSAPESSVIPLTRGAILYTRDEVSGDVLNFNVTETPPGNWTNNPNHVVTEWLTGRSHLERIEM